MRCLVKNLGLLADHFCVEGCHSLLRVRDQLSESTHYVECEQACAQIVDVLQKCDSVGALVHVSGYKSVFDYVEKFDGLCLSHTLIEVRD